MSVTSNIITDEFFENSSKEFSVLPRDYRVRDRYDPIAFHTYDQYEPFNRTVDDWDDNLDKEKEILAKHGQPPMPTYNPKERRTQVHCILELVDEPKRKTRKDKYVLIPIIYPE